jgi:4-amino-4-deoxy-L-arabinose transferase-like glycosyltransferase
MAFFGLLGGSLPMPPRDQELYIRLAGRIAGGRGLSFSPDEAAAKHGLAPENPVAQSWSGDEGLVFGIVPAGEPTAAVEPGYPLLLAGALALVGPATGGVFLLNTLFFLAGAFAVRLLVARRWGRGTGDLAAFLWAIYPPFVYYTAYAMTEAAHVSMLAVALAMTDRTDEGPGWSAAAGAVMGALFLVRATALLVLPFLAGWTLWRVRRRRGTGPALGRTVLMAVAFLAATVPWVARNASSVGSPVLMPTKGSLNIWMRNHPGALELEGIGLPGWVEDGIRRRELLDYPRFPPGAGEVARSEILGDRAVEFALANPVLISWLAVVRLGAFMDLSPAGGAAGLAQLLLFGGLMVLGCAGLYLHRRRPTAGLLALTFIAYAAIHALAHGGVRYRMPAETVMVIGTALLASRLLGMRGREDG